MTAPVELNTNINTNNNNALNMPNLGTNSNTQSKPKSIFDMQPSVNNYENDFMAGGIFAANALGTPQEVNNATNSFVVSQPEVETHNAVVKAPNFCGNENDLTRKISDNEKTNEPLKGDTKLTPNKYRNAGTLIGFLAPIATDAMNLFKGKSFTRAFNWKQLAITSPLVALAGFGIGAFIDSCLRANKAKEAVQG